MAKHKKTRKQKQHADTHRHIASEQAQVSVPKVQSISQSSQTIQSPQPIQYSLSSVKPGRTQAISNSLLYPMYVTRDLTRTGFITSGILAAEIILFILMHNHILAMPGG